MEQQSAQQAATAAVGDIELSTLDELFQEALDRQSYVFSGLRCFYGGNMLANKEACSYTSNDFRRSFSSLLLLLLLLLHDVESPPCEQ